MRQLALQMPRKLDQELMHLHGAIERYYSAKLSRYGPTPRGVDWTCLATQEMRFVQLLRICDFSSPFTLNDVGCGYGALLAHLAKRHGETSIDYLGVDLSPAMVRRGTRLWRHRDGTKFVCADAAPRMADYSVASGVFNVKLNHPIKLWERFVRQTLVDMHATSRRGFAVNFMAPTAPDQLDHEGLYRTRPDPWINFCARELGSTALLTDYGLREFTLTVVI